MMDGELKRYTRSKHNVIDYMPSNLGQRSVIYFATRELLFMLFIVYFFYHLSLTRHLWVMITVIWLQHVKYGKHMCVQNPH